MSQDDLHLIVAPHIVQDLSINLYTWLPRVIVEFVANAHDADAPNVDVQIDFEAIRRARNELRSSHDGRNGRIEDRELPEELMLKIVDNGHRMSRADIQDRFLIAGLRHRDKFCSVRSPGGRILMGRKGLGKLAGFGVAKRVTITSRRSEDNYATRVVLDFDELVQCPDKGRIPVPTETIETDLPPAGTEIALSRLMFEPVKSRRRTIESELAKHFRFVGAEDFQISINGTALPQAESVYAFEWPHPGERAGGLYRHEIDAGSQRRKINYRIRFTRKSLPARQRGVRIYASG